MASEISKAAIRNDLPEFFSQVRKRLRAGANVYGDISFSRDPMQLIGEVEQELLDVAGWSWILYHRLQKLKAALREIKTE